MNDITSSSIQVDSDGSEIGFGPLVQAIFEFIQALTERKKYKAMIRKVLPDVLFYLITYLSIPEYQVCLCLKIVFSVEPTFLYDVFNASLDRTFQAFNSHSVFVTFTNY